MNDKHAVCGGEEWRARVRHVIVPWAMADLDLGDDVLEVGPGYGATTEVLRERYARLTAVEIEPELARTLDERLAGGNVTVVEGDATSLPFGDDCFSGAVCFQMLHHVPSIELQDRVFAEVARVVAVGGRLVACDSLHRPELEAFHDGDTYLPVDPTTLDGRLRRCGFVDVGIDTGEHGWVARAVSASGRRAPVRR